MYPDRVSTMGNPPPCYELAKIHTDANKQTVTGCFIVDKKLSLCRHSPYEPRSAQGSTKPYAETGAGWNEAEDRYDPKDGCAKYCLQEFASDSDLMVWHCSFVHFPQSHPSRGAECLLLSATTGSASRGGC
jgi:hypothetical protein